MDFFKIACGRKDMVLWDLSDSLSPPAPDEIQEAAEKICPRRRGVGASGLLVLGKGEPVPELSLYRPGTRDRTPDFDSLLCASKYLYDSARYGNRPFTLRKGRGEYKIVPLDSLSIGVELGVVRSAGRHLVKDETRLDRWNLEAGSIILQGIPMEADQEALIFFDTAETPKTRKKWRKAFRHVPVLHGRIPTLVTLVGPKEIAIDFPARDPEPDITALAGLATLASYLEGVIDENILVRHDNSPYYVEINPQTLALKVTAPIHYIFKGVFSFEEYPF